MKTKDNSEESGNNNLRNLILTIPILIIFFSYSLLAQADTTDLARYTPVWIRHGFANAGATHEPWIFQVRQNNPDFNQWQKDNYDYQLIDAYILISFR